MMLALLLLSALNTSTADEAIVREVGAFRVHVHFDSERAADEAAAAMESTWKEANAVYGKASVPDEPLDVHLYRDIAAYEAAEDSITHGAFKRNLAFAHFNTMSAHVAVQPPLSDASLERLGLPKQTVRLLAHEAAHLARYERMPNFRSHPDWIADGLASSIDFAVIHELGLAPSFDEAPMSGTALGTAQDLLASSTLPTVAEILANADAKRPFFERYRVRWMFVEMLRAKHKRAFSKTLSSMRRLGESGNFDERVTEEMRRHFKRSFDGLDDDWQEFVAEGDVSWREQTRLLATGGAPWLQVAWPKSNAACWSTELLGGRDFSWQATVRLLPATKHQLNVRFGSRTQFAQVSLTAGYGLNVFANDGAWTTLASERLEGVAIDTPLDLALHYDAEAATMRVEVEGEVIHEFSLELADGATWALGAQAGSIVEWGDVEVKQAKRKRR